MIEAGDEEMMIDLPEEAEETEMNQDLKDASDLHLVLTLKVQSTSEEL